MAPTPPAKREPRVRVPEKRPLPATLNCCDGEVVPIPTFPFESMRKAVVEANDAEDEETATRGMLEREEVAETERSAQGEDVASERPEANVEKVEEVALKAPAVHGLKEFEKLYVIVPPRAVEPEPWMRLPVPAVMVEFARLAFETTPVPEIPAKLMFPERVRLVP